MYSILEFNDVIDGNVMPKQKMQLASIREN